MGRDRLKILIPERKGQTHYVSINDKSEFHRIEQEIAGLKKLLNNLNNNVPEKLAVMKKVKSTTAIESHFRNLVHIAQTYDLFSSYRPGYFNRKKYCVR